MINLIHRFTGLLLIVVVLLATNIYASSFQELPEKITIPSTLPKLQLRCTLAPSNYLQPETAPNAILEEQKTVKVQIDALGSKGLYNVMIAQPLSAGSYTLTITQKISGATTQKRCKITVIDAAIPQELSTQFSGFTPTFAAKISLKLTLPEHFKPLLPSLLYSYAMGYDQPTEIPYSPDFSSPYIPGAARFFALRLQWKHPQTGELYTLLSHQAETMQQAPALTGTPVVEPVKKSATIASKPGELDCIIRGFTLHYAVPVDINEQTNPATVVHATLGDVEIKEVAIVQDQQKSHLQVFTGEIADEKNPIILQPPSLSCSGTVENGEFVVLVKLKGLPNPKDVSSHSVRGKLTLRITTVINNRKAQKFASSSGEYSVPFNIPLHKK